MAGKKHSFTIYHRDIDPCQPNAPASVPLGDAQASTNDEQDRSKIEEENRRLKGLLRQHGTSDPTDPVHSIPFTDGLGPREQASPRGSPAPPSVSPPLGALQDEGTDGDGGGASVDCMDDTIEQDHHLQPMLLGASSISDDQHLQDNESYVAGPVSKKQNRSSSLPPPHKTVQSKSSRLPNTPSLLLRHRIC